MNVIQTDSKIQKIMSRLRELECVDPAHGIDHWERVANWCLRIYREELQANNENDERSAYACGLLHDCYPVAKDSSLRKESARLSAERAKDWLVADGWDDKQISEIVMAIEDHSFSAGRPTRNLLGRCLQDADRLEALGALGLYRTIAVGAKMGTLLFCPNDPFYKNAGTESARALDDRKYTLDHFFKKLFLLPDLMNTKMGRALAVDRAEYLRGFLKQLESELSGC